MVQPSRIPTVQDVIDNFPQVAAGLGNTGNSAMNVASLIGMAMNIWSISYEPDGEKLRQRRWALNPTNIIEPLDAAVSLQRGLIGPTSYNEVISRNGYGAEYQDIFKGLAEQVQTLDIILELNRRGEYNDADATAAIGRLGYPQGDSETLLGLKTRLPQTQDVLQWLVREVLDPAERTRLELDRDFPAESLPYFTQLGFNEEYAKNTWAAHWVLPSVNQAYTMYHRRLIEETDLQAILKAQDIAPIYRQPLVEAAYNPLTRVDVRRMHDLGVLTKSQVLDAYLDVGYNPTNAALLADFVERYNARNDNNSRSSAAVNGTISELIRAYQEEAISVGVLRQRLAAMELTEDRLDLIVNTQVSILRAKQLREVGLVWAARIKTGSSTIEAARAGMINAGADADDQMLWNSRFSGLVGNGDTALSKADLLRAYRQSLLTGDELMDKLRLLGYTTNDAAILLQSHGKQAEEHGMKLPSKKDMDTARTEGLITSEEWVEGLTALGFGEEWIDIYNKLWERKNADKETE